MRAELTSAASPSLFARPAAREQALTDLALPPSPGRRLFRLLSSAELRKRTRQAMVQETAYGVVLKDGVSKVTNEVEPGQQKRGDKGRAQGFSLMLRPNAHLLPDMDFALTGLAEVRRRFCAAGVRY